MRVVYPSQNPYNYVVYQIWVALLDPPRNNQIPCPGFSPQTITALRDVNSLRYEGKKEIFLRIGQVICGSQFRYGLDHQRGLIAQEAVQWIDMNRTRSNGETGFKGADGR